MQSGRFCVCFGGSKKQLSDRKTCPVLSGIVYPGWRQSRKNDDGKTYTKVSNAVYYDSTALPGIGDDSGSVTYHFRIPFLALEGGATVKRIGLYPNIISNEKDDLCAYYDFPEGSGIDIPTDGNNYTIIIEWKLTINNAK